MTDYFLHELAAEAQIRDRNHPHHATILKNLKREFQQTDRPTPATPNVAITGQPRSRNRQ
jgi:hypothetical protein